MVLVFRSGSEVDTVKRKATGYYIDNTFCCIRKNCVGIGNEIGGKLSKHKEYAHA
jgi:hypothetical protein